MVNFVMPEKEYSAINKELFNSGKEIIEDRIQSPKGGGYIGWCGFSLFVDWLEENYELREKKSEEGLK